MGNHKERYWSKCNAGLCTRCQNKAITGRRHCYSCLVEAREDSRKKARQRSTQSLCLTCGKPSIGYRYCWKHRRKLKENRSALKVETLNAYGGCVCSCCGEHHLEFLTIDHVDGDGSKHRKMLTGKSKGGGERFYRALKALGYPQTPRLSVLCFNCNAAKGRDRVCPHVLERIDEAILVEDEDPLLLASDGEELE